MSKPRSASERRVSAPFRLVRKGLGGLIAVLVMLSVATSAVAQSEIEFKVKAAFLFNFAKFTQWPTPKLSPADPLVIGCFSGSEFREVLETTVAGKTVGSRRIVVRQVNGADDLRAVHILFIGRSKDGNVSALLARAREMHVLTVGESEDFTGRGGMIGFVPTDGSVKFAINPQQAEEAGLRLSSKLLGLAVIKQ